MLGVFQHNVLRQFLCIDLDGNVSTSLTPPTEAKLKEYLSTLFEGMSDTKTQGKTFEEYVKTPEKIERSSRK